MKTKEAVALAKEGKEEGLLFLYQENYNKSYYVALKYMKNEEEALDVIHDAYIRAFNHMGQLQEEEKFPQWFAKIVASTALNELKKKKAVLFSQMNTEDNNFDIEDTFEDDRIDTQPELSYDKKETARLVKEMLDTLSDEQRICILMYYSDQLSVKEIAETLNCSENTVKSRLNYGRKKIKEKVLELEEKGTKLYSVHPVGLFMQLISNDIQYINPSAGSFSMFKRIENEVNEAKRAGNLMGRVCTEELPNKLSNELSSGNATTDNTMQYNL
jgi:RNA polymerase sigma factor (sigma-70 family)